MAGVGRRLERLEEASCRSAAARIRRAWLEMSDEEIVLVLAPYRFGREPTDEEADATNRANAAMPEDLIARAVGCREGMGDEELDRRMRELLEPVLSARREGVLRRMRADEGGRAS